MSSNAEAEAESETTGSLLTPTFVFQYMVQQLAPLILGIFVSFSLFFYARSMEYSTYHRIGLFLLPIIVSIIFIWYSAIPKPKYHYFLSILYEPKPINTGYTRQGGGEGVWPFVGSAVIRLNNQDHIFIGGGEGQADQLLVYDKNKKKFKNVINKTQLSDNSATYSAVSIDLDHNGLDDLIVGRHNGVTLYKQMEPMKFIPHQIMGSEDRIPAALSVSDYNKDGRPDIYVSYFTPMNKYRGTVFNDPSHNRPNVLLENTSSKDKITFKDVTTKTNAAGLHNTFTSAFIDLNNDTWPDLVLSHDSGEIEILRNNEGTFTSIIPYPYKGNWMGLAVGDIDEDGYQDIFLTNLGSDISRDRMSKGDIQPGQKQAFAHVLLRNDGDFKMMDVMEEKGIPGDGFGWGAIMADLNLDGRIDLLFGENFSLIPRHHINPGPGHVYYQDKAGQFQRRFKYKNKNFAQTPLLADLNGDNIKDVIWINMHGPSIAYINNEKSNYLNVRLPETVEFVNAKVTITVDGQKQYRENIQGGIGFGSDSSNIISFGLGDKTTVDLVTVKTLDGKIYNVKNPRINSTIRLTKIR